MSYSAKVLGMTPGSGVFLEGTFSTSDKAWKAVRAFTVRQGQQVWFPWTECDGIEYRPVRTVSKAQQSRIVGVAFVYPSGIDQAVVEARAAIAIADASKASQ